jgi:hypothetical protein
MRAAAVCVLLLFVLFPAAAGGQDRWRLDGGLTFGHFEQQVKSEVGGLRGERLVTETQLGVGLIGSARVWRFLSAGLFARLDVGARRAGRFAGFDEEGRAVVSPEVGGGYRELWLGPITRAQWRRLFVELGYGLLALRGDDARGDLPASDGDSRSAFRGSPAVVWLLALGGDIPLLPRLDLALRVEYRIRYYDRRGGDALAGEIVHGTQNLTPFVGLVFRP